MPADPLFFVTPAYGRSAGGGLGVSAERIARHLAGAFSLRVVTLAPQLQPWTYQRGEVRGVELLQLGHTGNPKTLLQFLADVLEAESRHAANPRFLGFYCNEMAYAVTLAAARHGAAPLLFARGNDVDLDVFGEFASTSTMPWAGPGGCSASAGKWRRRCALFAPAPKRPTCPTAWIPTVSPSRKTTRPMPALSSACSAT
nr:hypothetical protein [Methylogaea oryzae]